MRIKSLNIHISTQFGPCLLHRGSYEDFLHFHGEMPPENAQFQDSIMSNPVGFIFSEYSRPSIKHHKIWYWYIHWMSYLLKLMWISCCKLRYPPPHPQKNTHFPKKCLNVTSLKDLIPPELPDPLWDFEVGRVLLGKKTQTPHLGWMIPRSWEFPS